MTEHKARRTRRSFAEDYKAGAVWLVLDERKTVTGAARVLGLTTAEREELARLRKERRKLRMERDLLSRNECEVYCRICPAAQDPSSASAKKRVTPEYHSPAGAGFPAPPP